MNRVVTTMLVVVAVIHLLPVSGLLGAEQLNSLYGLSFEESNIEILMRHRAVLFAIFGGFLLFSAFKPIVHIYALVAATISVLSFLYIAQSVGAYNEQVGRVFMADIVALLCIAVAIISHFAKRFNLSSKE